MGVPPAPGLVEISSLPLGGKRLTPKQWHAIEALLDAWEADVLRAARRHPARSYKLGAEQVRAFADLLAGLQGTPTAPAGAFGGTGPGTKAAIEWQQRYLLRELEDAMAAYKGRIKDELLYGLHGGLNPTQIASRLFNATQDATVNWRQIARTELVRANLEGRLKACEDMGYDRVWVPPHAGSCKQCRRLLEGKVFTTQELRGAYEANRGKPAAEWVPAIPQHPHCRHSVLPYEPEVYETAMGQYSRMGEAGLMDDRNLDEWFDSSGQLKPEYADSVDFSAAKTMQLDASMQYVHRPAGFDPYVEGLAAAVHKVTKAHSRRAPVERFVALDALRTDLYQRAIDPDRVLTFAQALRAGGVAEDKLPPVEVSEREDGTKWVVDGQHRVEAFKLAGRSSIRARVHQGLSWGEEAERCRAAIAKALDPLPATQEMDAEVDPVVRFASWLDNSAAVFKSGAPVLEQPEPEASSLAPEYSLTPVVWDGLRPRPEVVDRARAWWAHTVGEDWADWSWLYLTGLTDRLEVVVDYPALRERRAHLGALADTDLHLWLVMLARRAAQGTELAPGVGIEVRVAPEHTPAELVARVEAENREGDPFVAGNWSLAEQQWIGPLPAVAAKSLADVLPDYAWAPRPRGIVAKATKAKERPADVGVEHWITVHPNGDDAPGQPVLVRNGSDGTMTVIGGAGGNLNYLRLDPKRRIKPKKDKQQQEEPAAVEQPVDPEEAAAAQAEHEERTARARETIDAAQRARAAKKDELHAYLRDELGIDPHDPELTAKQRAKLLRDAHQSALRTLAHGEISRRDAQDSPTREQLGLDDPDAPKPWADDDSTGERKLRPKMAMTAEQAEAVMRMHTEMGLHSKQASRARKAIAGAGQAGNAYALDWSHLDVEEKVAEKVAGERRTHLARQLLESGESPGNSTRFGQAFTQGGYDSVDSFSHEVLGQSVLSKEAHQLLGVAGSAQLAAHAIHQKEGVDLDVVKDALKALTDDQEAAVVERGLARVRAATEQHQHATKELLASEKGESLYTTTMARSIQTAKLQEAARGLGMMIGGLEATSALKVALDRGPGEKIKVGGFASPAQVKELAKKARVKVTDRDITKVAAGNYTLNVEPERLAGLLRPQPKADEAKLAMLEGIRTADDLDQAVEDARRGPGMSDTLDPNQARGKLFLQAAGSGVLAFDPGVGKTHTAIAAAMDLMHREPDAGHRVLIVAPTNVMGSWAKTIAAQGSGRSVQVLGQQIDEEGKITGGKGRGARQKQYSADQAADFNIVSYDTLRNDRRMIEKLGHTIVVSDELQKVKNENKTHRGVEHAVKAARDQHADKTRFWGLTGTPIEKDVSDLHAMVKLAKQARGEEVSDRKNFRSKYGKLGQDEQIARGDRIRQFREAVDENMFRLTAQQAGNDLPEPTRQRHTVELDDAHRQKLLDTVATINQRRKEGIVTPFGGRQELLDALYNHEGNAMATKAADIIDGLGTFDHEGGQYKTRGPNGEELPDDSDRAGSYEHKAIIFGGNQESRALFGADWSKRSAPPGGLHAELERRGVKVFVGHGQLSSKENDDNIAAYLAHPGKAVFLTNDKNNAGVSLQFGDNRGTFQHGATHMIHFTRPVNNATIQQREARALRKGAQAGVTYHTISADTPVEQRLEDTLDQEARTQDLAGNSDQQVTNSGREGADTFGHHLRRAGEKARRTARKTFRRA